jgi:kinetochore protein NDC80
MKSIHQLVEYLVEHGYNQPISTKILTAPSSKDFFLIFQFLVNQLDPNFQYIQQKPEEDCPMIFKLLKYPVAVSKRSLLSVGSPHTWPALLAALAWFVELLQYYSKWVEIYNTESEDDDSRIFFQYLTNAYKSFLEGEDSFTALDQELEEKYGISSSF